MKSKKEVIQKIDEVIVAVREAAEKSNFDFYDLHIILCLELVKLEILSTNKITDETLSALWEIWSMSSFVRYKQIQQDELYDQVNSLREFLMPYNPNMYNADLSKPKGGFNKKAWLEYFDIAIAKLFRTV